MVSEKKKEETALLANFSYAFERLRLLFFFFYLILNYLYVKYVILNSRLPLRLFLLFYLPLFQNNYIRGRVILILEINYYCLEIAVSKITKKKTIDNGHLC